MRPLRFAVALFLCSATGAFAQTPEGTVPTASTSVTPPTHGLFVEGAIGANFLGLDWDSAGPITAALEYPPNIRVGGYFSSLAVSGSLGLSTALDPASGNNVLDLTVGGQVKPYFGTYGALRAYWLGGVDLGLLLDPVGTSPEAGLNLGFGAQYFITRRWALGGEVGIRPKVLFPATGTASTAADFSTGIYLALTVTWMPGPSAPSTAGQAPAAQAEPPPKTQSREEPDCLTYLSDGWLEPSQGVWQDDLSFDDKPRKQLTRTSLEGASYAAELDMVVGKDTLVFGVHHYRHAGTQTTVDSRDAVVLKGLSNCPEALPVKLRLSLREGLVTRELATVTVVGQVPLKGKATAKMSPWEVTIPAQQGLPEKPFRFESPLPYELKAELVQADGSTTGLQATVTGQARSLLGPTVAFVPVVFDAADLPAAPALAAAAQTLAENTAKLAPDLLPLPPGGLPTTVRPVADFSAPVVGPKWLEGHRTETLLAGLSDALSTQAFLEGGGRVVGVVSRKDFQTLFAPAVIARTTVRPRSVAELSWKVLVVPSDETWDTVVHGLVHTLPDAWADEDMRTECGKAYHNKRDGVAHGVRIDTGGVAGKPERKTGAVPLLGPAENVNALWTTQCTWWHLAKELADGPPDPPVVLVRATLLKDGAQLKGELRPLYTIWGHSDFTHSKPGGYFLVTRTDLGTEIARFPFSPSWTDLETGANRRALTVAYRVPWRPDLDTVELVGPGNKVLDKKKLSSNDPSVEFESPRDRHETPVTNGKIHVVWRGKSDSQGPLLYSVLYSSDEGATYTTQVFEQAKTECDVTVDPKATKHRIKVTVTDGSRSGSKELRVTTAATK